MRTIAELPRALESREEIARRIAGKRVAVFLDYDGTLTPIVERPELAVLSEEMRRIVRELAARVPVAVVSGRDRADVERLVGVEELVFAGSHGFDIATPDGRTIERGADEEHSELMARVCRRFQGELGGIQGVLIEPKRSSVAVHYRQVAPGEVKRVEAAVEAVLGDHPELRVTPGKKVWEIQPAIDWHKGEAVLWLLRALELDGEEVVPIYLGDDVTDEDAFRALAGRGISLYVGEPDGAEAERETAADFLLRDPDEVGRFLAQLAR